MKRFIASIALLLATSVAWGQGYNPEIAYTQVAGKAATLYLANRDGSHVVPIYSVPTKTRKLGKLDFAPGGGSGGGKISLVDTGALKVLTYAVTQSGISVTGVITLNTGTGSVDDPDFSPDGNFILYTTATATPGRKMRIISASSGATPTNLDWVPPQGVFGVRELRWLRTGDAFAFLTYGPNSTDQLHRADLNPDGTISVSTLFTTTGQEFLGIEEIDTARTSNAILFAANYSDSIRILKYDLDLQAFADTRARGARAHYSSSDAQILHHGKDGKYLAVYNIGTETSSPVTASARLGFGFSDWKP